MNYVSKSLIRSSISKSLFPCITSSTKFEDSLGYKLEDKDIKFPTSKYVEFSLTKSSSSLSVSSVFSSSCSSKKVNESSSLNRLDPSSIELAILLKIDNSLLGEDFVPQS
ncbi:hypothetical protein F8M41_018427 [Gigaspora margarita]|uniref:Uncharacterized protein n=1 Tax=Gigaspora margarita TaxID=4874 RepID=A0A8H4ALQ7_GIGMA|nr:hypothetical protein F8M41_018427 [Gigaspora margarita]